MAKGDSGRQESLRKLLQPGISAFEEQCMAGITEIETDGPLFAVPLMVVPRTQSDKENYQLVEGQGAACLIAARARTEGRQPLFRSRADKIFAIELMVEKMDGDMLDKVAADIQLHFGEISQRHYDILASMSWDSSNDSALLGAYGEGGGGKDEEEGDETDIDSMSANSIMSKAMADQAQADIAAGKGTGYGGDVDADLGPNDPAPVMQAHAPEGVDPGYQRTPTVLQAEGNSAPPQG